MNNLHRDQCVNEHFSRLLQSPRTITHQLTKTAARRYLVYAALGGIVGGMIQFGEVIARKSLGASELAVTLLTMTGPVASITAIWWGRILVGRDQRKLLIYFGAIVTLAMASGIFLRTMEHLFCMTMVFALVSALVVPSENRVFQQHIPSNKTGKTFGISSAVRTITAASISVAAGWYLDNIEGGYRHLYLAAAPLYFLTIWQIASIRVERSTEPRMKIGWNIILEPLRKLKLLLKQRRDYYRFEQAFMIYGMAFMITMPVIPLYLVDDLELSYKQIGIARGMVPMILQIAAIPFFGWVFDRTTPHRMAVFVFAALSFFPPLLLLAGHAEGVTRTVMIYVAFGWFGVAMSGLSVIWSLSSLRFARGEDAGVFHSVHVTATGIRGSFAPLIGYAIMQLFGKEAALLTASVIWIFASGMMIVIRLIDVKRGDFRSLRAQV